MLGLSLPANAELFARGGGLIYDSDLNITWLTDTNYAASELTDSRVSEIISTVGSVAGHTLTPDDFLKDNSGNYTGQMTWWGTVAWVDQLVYFDPVRSVSYDDWRLPVIMMPDAGCTDLDNTPRGDSLGYNCTGSELGHLFYSELGGTASSKTASLLSSNDPDLALLSNLQLNFYHSANEVADCPNLPSSDCNGYFSFYSGFQWAGEKRNHFFAWAVRDGDVAAQDADSDGIDNAVDNCVFVPNPMQEDMDSDGIGDGCDNCRHVANTDQRDSDSDGYGSLCDADFNNDGIVNFTDSAYLNSVFSTADPLADLNGDGIVDSADHSIMISLFFKHPGPVGFASIAFDNVNSTAGITRNDNTFGVSWGDLNSDGLPDALLSNHFKTPSLYLNQGDGSFLEVAAAHELTMNPEDPHGAAWADYDNDGDQDAVMVSGGPGWSTAFLINESGTLKIHDPNVTGLSYGWSDRTPTWLDENNDGLLDITIVSTSSKHPQFKSVMFNQNSDHTFEIKHDFGVGGAWASLLTGPLLSAVPEILFSSGNSFTRESGAWVNNTAQVFPPGTQSTIGTDYAYGDVNGDGILDLYVFRQGNRAQLTTEGNLVQATYRAVANNLSGFDFITDGTSLTINFGLSIAPNQFRLGAGQVPATVIGEFNSVIVNSTSPEVLGEPTITLGTQAVWVWYNPDLKQWHVRFGNASSNRNVEFHIESDQPVTNLSGVNFPVDSLQRNYLYLGNGAGGFLPDDLQSGLSFTGPTRAGAFGDFDNDMDLDLYLVNRNAATNAPNQLFTNDGAGNFTEVIGAGNAEGSTSGSGESVSTADYDQDGFLDLFVTNGRSDLRNPYPGPHELFHNTGNGNHWLEIDLIGVQSTRDAIGAFVELEAGGKKQVRFQDGGIHAFGQHHQRVHFGLAQSEKADLIRIHWPSGIVQELTDIPADQLLQVHEPSAPGLIGAPSIIPGAGSSGVYLWKDSNDSPYKLRVVGDPVVRNYVVTLLSSQALSSVQPFSLESRDSLELFTYGFRLQAQVLNGQDGLNFDLPTGSKVMISVTEEGKPHPRHLKIGQTATSIPPAGWVIDATSLGLRPNATPGEMGLFLGNRSGTGNITEFRWRADGRLHDVELDLMSGESLLNVQPVGLSGNDSVVSGNNWVKVNSRLHVGQDGIDIDRSANSIIGIAFQMDELLPAYRVFSGTGSLGLPNAYWLDTGAPSPIPATGQVISFAAGGDGDLQKGVLRPTPRFTDNGDGTVIDNLTGLIWLQQASACFGQTNWTDAMTAVSNIGTGMCNLSDGSQPGDWRVPSARELLSLIDHGVSHPAITPGHSFQEIESLFHWSSTTTSEPWRAWGVQIAGGNFERRPKDADTHPVLGNPHFVWPVKKSP